MAGRRLVELSKSNPDFVRGGISCEVSGCEKTLNYCSSMKRHLQEMHKWNKEEVNFAMEKVNQNKNVGIKYSKKKVCVMENCKYQFSYEKNYIAHLKNIHKCEGLEDCEGEKWPLKERLTRKMNCPKCDFRSDRKSHWVTHMKRLHEVENSEAKKILRKLLAEKEDSRNKKKEPRAKIESSVLAGKGGISKGCSRK